LNVLEVHDPQNFKKRCFKTWNFHLQLIIQILQDMKRVHLQVESGSIQKREAKKQQQIQVKNCCCYFSHKSSIFNILWIIS